MVGPSLGLIVLRTSLGSVCHRVCCEPLTPLLQFPIERFAPKAVSAGTPVGDVDNQHVLVQFKENGSGTDRAHPPPRGCRRVGIAENRGALPLQLLPRGEPVVRRFLDAIHDGKVHFDELGVTDLDILFPPVVSPRLSTLKVQLWRASNTPNGREATCRLWPEATLFTGFCTPFGLLPGCCDSKRFRFSPTNWPFRAMLNSAVAALTRILR